MSVYTKKSDTVEEHYAHVDITNSDLADKATVFARKEGSVWVATVAYCSLQDQFSRRIGRNVARRRYFTEPDSRAILGEEWTFEAAVKLAEEAAPASAI